MDTKVNTLVIGAGRAGTTTLCEFLSKQPRVCFSNIKEIAYFSINDQYKRGEDYYHSFFDHYRNEPVVASADTYLLMDYQAIERIYAYNPQMKFIIMLRNPVDRAYSSYNYSVHYGHHKVYSSFLTSIEKEENIAQETHIVTRNNLGHFYGSLYYQHLSVWMSKFPKNQFLLIKLDDFVKNGTLVANQLSNFLGTDITFELPDSKKLNAHAVPRFKGFEQLLLNRDNLLRKLIRKITPVYIRNLVFKSKVIDKLHDINRKQQPYAALTASEKETAMNYFKNDLEQMKREFGIDLA